MEIILDDIAYFAGWSLGLCIRLPLAILALVFMVAITRKLGFWGIMGCASTVFIAGMVTLFEFTNASDEIITLFFAVTFIMVVFLTVINELVWSGSSRVEAWLAEKRIHQYREEYARTEGVDIEPNIEVIGDTLYWDSLDG